MQLISDSILGPTRADAALILDAGCGTGGNISWLQQRGKTFEFDFSTCAEEFVRRRKLRRFCRGDVCDIPFASSCFDLVTSFDVLYHKNVASDDAAVAELARVLKPGGRLLLRVNAYEWLRSSHDDVIQTRKRYTVGETRRLVMASGLRIIRLTCANTLLFPLLALFRVYRRIRPTPGSDLTSVSSILNSLLLAVLVVEAAVLRVIDFPFGLSIFVLAEKER